MRRNSDFLPVLRARSAGLSPLSPFSTALGMSPFQVMRRMQEDMDRLFSQVAAPGQEAGMPVFAPTADLSETDQEFRLEADLPGVRQDDIDIHVQDNTLVITATLRQEQTSEPGQGRQYHRRERRSGYFQEVLPLPTTVDQDGIRAEFSDGVLRVHLPKAAPAQPQGRRISVQAGQQPSDGAAMPGEQTVNGVHQAQPSAEAPTAPADEADAPPHTATA